MVDISTDLLTPFSKVRLAFSRFSRNARNLDTVLVQNWSAEFHENRSKGLISDTE